jgi:TonB family protein
VAHHEPWPARLGSWVLATEIWYNPSIATNLLPQSQLAAGDAAATPFNAVPVAGGSPDYPDEYADNGQSGQVTVSCTIQATGFPTACHIVGVQGGRKFSAAVLRWLDSGRVRYAPVRRGGQPIAATEQWALKFKQ